MKNPANKSLFALILSLLALHAAAEADFLLLEPSAKALGMGGAFAASSNSPANLRYNPAGLASLKGSNVSLSHQDAYGDWSHEWVAAATSVDSTAYAVEFSMSSMKAFELYDENDNVLGSATAGSQALGFAVARNLFGFDAGAGIKAFRSQLMDFSSSGYSMDLGLRYAVKGPGLAIGISAQNLGEATSYDGGEESLPALFRAGLSWEKSWQKSAALGISADGLRFMNPAYESELRLGGSLSLYSTLNFSLGLQQSASSQQMTFGVGATLGIFELSYAFLPGNVLGNTQLISLELKL